MTVAELIEKLKGMPLDLQVRVLPQGRIHPFDVTQVDAGLTVVVLS